MKKRHPFNVYKGSDIAVVKLDVEKLPAEVIPFCMPKTSDRLTAGDELEIIGYGPAKSFDGKTRRLPRSAIYVVNSSKECSERFRQGNNFDPKHENCGYPKDHLVKVHHEDAGGPVVRNKVLRGIVRWTASDSTLGDTVVFSDIVAYTPWLKLAVKHLPSTRKHGVYQLSLGGTLYPMQVLETVAPTRQRASVQ
ncbi:unnamed protein product [Soboliphyme baturini]|uniref:Peptidase S1 domain-containing protein n=1 Tax=Soboliphyme baturini TaxID=241478 RepID=A0A183IPQ1_9BILA|nr:unnamed protein product [Soboliphyme baturini]